MFVLDIPPNFERHIVQGRPAEIQVNIDATAMGQAGGSTRRFTSRPSCSAKLVAFRVAAIAAFPLAIELVIRRARLMPTAIRYGLPA